MTYWTIFCAALYLAGGALFWENVVMRTNSISDIANCRCPFEAARQVETQLLLRTAQRNQCLALYTCKATIVLFWPLAAIYGFVTARLLGW